MDQSLSVLLIEDDKIDQMAFERMVREQKLPYDYEIVGNLAQTARALAERTFDVVIADYLLGDGTAFDVLELVPEDVPVIFATGAGDEEIAVKALRTGAADYLIKDVNRNYLKVLPITVDHILGHRRAQHAVVEMRESMIHTMVHDLRNPLGAIYTALKISLTDADEPLPESQEQVLQIALNNAEKMMDLVNSILDVSKLESGQMPLDLGPVPLHEIVDRMVEQLSPLAREKRLSLERDVPETLPLAWVDRRLVGRVLQNLLDNAVKFTPAAGTVRIKARHLPGDPEMLRVVVSDDGPGISEDLRGRLFQKFVTGRHRAHGSGLGLAFCKLVVEAHGGEIALESAEGDGATFAFTLPVTPDEIYQEVMST